MKAARFLDILEIFCMGQGNYITKYSIQQVSYLVMANNIRSSA